MDGLGIGGSPWPLLAHAFLTVTTAAERAEHPAPDGLIPITVNELKRPLPHYLLRPNHTPQRLTNGHSGGDDTKPEPAPATT